MESIKDFVEKLSYCRIDEIRDVKKSGVRLNGFWENLEGEAKAKLRDILDEQTAEQDRRESKIYIRGLMDGCILINYLTGKG